VPEKEHHVGPPAPGVGGICSRYGTTGETTLVGGLSGDRGGWGRTFLPFMLIIFRVYFGEWVDDDRAGTGRCSPTEEASQHIARWFRCKTNSAGLIGENYYKAGFFGAPHGPPEASDKGVLASEKLDCLVRIMIR